MIRFHVVSAVCSRNLKQYFSGVLGYVFIFVFVVVSSVMAFSQQFFADNLANLDQLTRYFPLLLLFLAPAIAMTVWSDERRQGTDAILFTLPASDFEILMGKFLAVASVYTIALLFSLTQLIALAFLGSPDWGVIAATYLGYWLAGLALISIAMFASSLTDSATVAFVIGAILCSIPVLIGYYFRGKVGWERLGFDWYLNDFANGLVLWSNVFYFVAIIILMLYLNLVVISRRHWSRGQQMTLSGHFAVRVLALLAILAAWNYVLQGFSASRMARIDLTADRVYSLTPVTLETLRRARDNERPVTIQAFVSRDVPRHFVNTRKRLLGLLRQFDTLGGGAVEVRIIDVVANSESEIEAQNNSMVPVVDRSEIGGKLIEQKIYLGAHVSSPLGDVTLATIDNQAAIEYELARSVAMVTDREFQLTVGIVDTDSHFMGPEVDGVRSRWIFDDTNKLLTTFFKTELVNQESLRDFLPVPADAGVPNATPGAAARQAPNVLLVPDPSSLSQSATAALIEYIQAGNPAILLMDPVPAFFAFHDPTEMGVMTAPRQSRVSPDNPYAAYLASSIQPKADSGSCSTLMQALGVHWDSGEVAYHLANPHSGFGGTWPTYLGESWPRFYGPFEQAFVFCQSGQDSQQINDQHLITAGLKELLFFYVGHFQPTSNNAGSQFTPLVTLASTARLTSWDEATFVPKQPRERINPQTRRREFSQEPMSNRFTMDELRVLRADPQSRETKQTVVVAAHVRGTTDQNKTNVVLIADTDFLTNWYLMQEEALGLPLDNLKLLVNAIEVLAGQQRFVALRNRRVTPRTLTVVEQEIERFREERSKKQKELEAALRDEIAKAQLRFDDAAKRLGEDNTINTTQRTQQFFQEFYDAQAQFDRQKEKLEAEVNREVDRLKAEERRRISRLENFIRNLAVGLAPLPALVLGIVVLSWRRINENRLIRPERKAR